MRYISMFSGIEAASVAFHPLAWEPICFAEVEAFPSAVLAHHYPTIPNIGDVTAHDWGQYRGSCDLVVGGPPCQDFSVAGLRASMGGARGNLSLAYVEAVDAIDPLWCLTENVPGWLSTGDNAFGHFLAAMVGSDAPLVPGRGQRWTDAGVASGPKRTAAWRILDAQYFGVPQRRRRVFVVAVRGSGNWAAPAALFPIGSGLRGDPAPRREAGENAPTIPSRGTAGGGLGTDFDCDGGLIAKTLSASRGAACANADDLETYIPIAFSAKDHGGDASDISPTLRAGGFTKSHANAGVMPAVAFGGNNTAGPVDVATACNAHGGPHGRLDFESETFVAYDVTGVPATTGARGTDVHTPLRARAPGGSEASTTTVITHSLRADGFDAS